MMKRAFIRSLGLLVAGLLLCVQLVACTQGTQLTLEEQLELGVRYLGELDYENAVIAFTAAIEIDPKNAQGYAGLYTAYTALDKTEKADEVWSAMLEAGVSSDEVLTWVDTMRENAGIESPSADATVQPDQAAVPQSLSEREEQDLLDAQQEVYTGDIAVNSPEYNSLLDFLYTLFHGYGRYSNDGIKGLYDYRASVETNSVHGDNLLACLLNQCPCYPMVDEAIWQQDPLKRWIAYSVVSKDRAEWILKNAFNCLPTDIEAMEDQLTNGNNSECYYYDGNFYYNAGGGWGSIYTSEIEHIQQVGPYYYVQYSMVDDISRMEPKLSYTALLKLKKIDGEYYWSLYYNQQGFLLPENSWPYQELSQLMEDFLFPLLYVQPTGIISEEQRATYIVTAEPSLNVRTGPDTSYERLGEIPESTIVTGIGAADGIEGWIVVEYSDEYENKSYGWVSAEFLEKQ